jgi:protein-S-isoprenylcysteine O-methyltransferase Ste14
MKPTVWFAIGAEAFVFGVILFGAAGTVRWPAAWAFLAVFFGAAVLLTRALARRDPALLDERMKPFVQKSQPVWDRVLMSSIAVAFFAWLALMGLDAGRFHWSMVPLWVHVAGAAGIAITMWVCHLVFRENTFLVNVVTIQDERGHTVVTTGPYAVVRHPMYAAVLVMFPSMAFMLGSWHGLAATTILDVGLVIRTVMEDRELYRRLEGYAEYARKVRYRLVPWIW